MSDSGQSIKGYVTTQGFTNAGGGQCQWTFAKKSGRHYFLKRFLRPTYPLPDGPGSAAIKARKRQECEAFEQRQRDIIQRLKPLSTTGGNLVVARDFFRHGAHYYKVTDKVDVASEDPSGIATLSGGDNLIVLLAVAHSLDILHRNGLVHGDIKPANILNKRTSTGVTSKLIDFDDCFVEREPPPAADTVGDPVYYAPELVDYIVDNGPADLLSVKSDVFALGLVFAEYLTGNLPDLPAGHRYPGEAVRAGARLPLSVPTGRAPVGELVEAMLSAEPAHRPSCREVHEALQRIRRAGREGASTSGLPPGERTEATGLQGTLLRKLAGHHDSPPELAKPPLRGSLLKKGKGPAAP